MNTINDRILHVIRYYNYNVRSLSLELGYKGSTTINNIVSGKRNNPSYEMIVKLARKFPEININWLLLNDGEMLIAKYKTSLKDYSNEELLDHLIENRDEFSKDPKMKIAMDIFTSIDQQLKIEATHKKVEEIAALLKKNEKLLKEQK